MLPALKQLPLQAAISFEKKAVDMYAQRTKETSDPEEKNTTGFLNGRQPIWKS